MKPQTAIVQLGLDHGLTPREVAAVNLVAFVESVGKNLPDEQLRHNALAVVDALIVAATEPVNAVIPLGSPDTMEPGPKMGPVDVLRISATEGT